MRIGIADHHGKSAYLAKRLAERFDVTTDMHHTDFDVLLVDSDSPYAAPMPQKHNLVKHCNSVGIPVVLYPHGAQTDLEMDGLRKFQAQISLQLVHGEGAVEVYKRSGLKHRFESVGWTYGPILSAPHSGSATRSPSGPRDSVGLVASAAVGQERVPGRQERRTERVGEKAPIGSLLFAPIHPWADGQQILRPHAALNTLAYQQFLEHPAPHKIVRSYGEDGPNGIHERVDGVEYTQSDLNIPWDLLDRVDAVISYGTLAHCALAAGKPTAFIYDLPSHTLDDGSGEPAHFQDYKELVRYPAGIGTAPLEDLFRMDVSEWVDQFIGGPLNLDKLSWLLFGFTPNRAMRRKKKNKRVRA